MTTSIRQQAADDPMQAAMIAPEQDRHYFGIATVDSWFCVLAKGQGKRPWDASHDSIADRRIAIKLSIECDKRDGGRYSIDQETLNFEKTWVSFTLPSLQKLGVSDLRTLNGAAVHVKRTSTGETYTNKQSEVKTKSAIIFLEIFPDTEAATAAQEAFYGGKSNGSYAGMPEATLPDPTQPQMSPEQQFALNSLPALWKASGQDKAKFEQLITQNPLISKHYPFSHPHVQGLISGTLDDLFEDKDLPF